MDCRSSLAFPTPSGSSGLCLRAPVAGLLHPLYFSTSFGLPIPQGCARFLVGFQNLRSFHLSALPVLTFRALDFPLPKLLPVRDLPKPKLLRSVRPSISVNCFQSFDLLRLAPPGVYLKGSRLPFESPFNGTTGFCRARSGRRTQYHVSTYPSSATLHFAFRRVGRPAGGFRLTGY